MPDYLTLSGAIQKKRLGLSSRADQFLTNFPVALSAVAEVGEQGSQRVLAVSPATLVYDTAALAAIVPYVKALAVYIYGDDPRLDLYLASSGTKIPIDQFFYMQFSANPTRVEFRNPTTSPVKFDLWLVGTTV